MKTLYLNVMKTDHLKKSTVEFTKIFRAFNRRKFYNSFFFNLFLKAIDDLR